MRVKRVKQAEKPPMQTPAPPGAGLECEKLSLDQSNVSGAGSLRRLLSSEFHSLSFPKQLED